MKDDGSGKFFCISFQRTGTTSVGRFFSDHDFKVATFKVSRNNAWTENWFKGDYESIFSTDEFKSSNVFEDDPWWCMDFYKYLFHRFPKAKFVLFTRDADHWFESMIRHSGGKTLGNTYIHSHIYGRETEFAQLSEEQRESSMYSSRLDSLLPLREEYRQQYVDIYNSRNSGIVDFFEKFGRDRLFVGNLEDDQKWYKLGKFSGISVDDTYDAHEHKAGAKSL